MRNYLMLFLAVMITVAVLPIFASKSVAARDVPIVRVETGGEVEELSVEDYALLLMLDCADAVSEYESLKTLAVSARSCAIYLSYYGCKHESFDVCTDGECCFSITERDDVDVKLYDECVSALSETCGQVLCYGDIPAMALYTLCSGSGSADCEEFEYLSSVPEPARCELHKTEKTVDEDILSAEVLSDACFVYGETEKCEFAVIEGKLVSGSELRAILALPTQEIVIEKTEDGFSATAYGIGHCYGLSLCGADKKADEGMEFEEILKYYYPKLDLNKIYN